MSIKILLIISLAAMTLADLSVSLNWFNTRRISVIAGGVLINALMIVHVIILGVELKAPEFITGVADKYVQLSPVLPLVLPLLVIAHSFACIAGARRMRKRSITRGTVRDAVNKLEYGLLYSEPDGTVNLMNRVMSNLVKKLTGREVHNSDLFWNKVVSYEKNESAKRIDFSDGPAFLFDDGKVWSFKKVNLNDGDRSFDEIIARDVTDLYQKTEKMKQDIAELEVKEAELYNVFKKISETGNQEELLNYKISIHDRLGNAILRLRQLLRGDNPSDEDISNVIGIWDSTVKAFRANTLDAAVTGSENYASLLSLAKTLGIELIIKGDFPQFNETALKAVREAMYNAIRHAYANKVTVESFITRDSYRIHIYDDGRCDKAGVVEGGGLSALRKAVEEGGGSMQVTIWDGVELNLVIRK